MRSVDFDTEVSKKRLTPVFYHIQDTFLGCAVCKDMDKRDHPYSKSEVRANKIYLGNGSFKIAKHVDWFSNINY